MLAGSVRAYRIEVTVAGQADTPIFLAGYYGERISVIDSARTNADGKAIFARDVDLCPGIYTLAIPGKLSYDILTDGGQTLSIDIRADNKARITGDASSAAYAEYLTLPESRPGKEQAVAYRRQTIGQHPETFLAAYFTAMQPVEADDAATDDPAQMMKAYQYRRRHFFDHFDLSDVRLLRTPLYHEKVQYYITKFVTQQADTLIHIAYRMLERASGNGETFFYMSDFLIDFSLRSKIKDINKLHNFLMRNRDMLGVKAYTALSAKSKINYFKLPDENAWQTRLENMPLTDADGLVFDPKSIKSKYRILYFWKPDCPRCVADAARFRSVLNKYRSKSCFGIAVNTEKDVRQPDNRILAYEPLCVNVSLGDMSQCARIFFAGMYAKIIVTDTAGNMIGIFGSAAALDNFLMRL